MCGINLGNVEDRERKYNFVGNVSGSNKYEIMIWGYEATKKHFAV